MSYVLGHTSFGFCLWDIPALIVLVVSIIFFVLKHRDMKKEEQELEDQLAAFYAEDTNELNQQM